MCAGWSSGAWNGRKRLLTRTLLTPSPTRTLSLRAASFTLRPYCKPLMFGIVHYSAGRTTSTLSSDSKREASPQARSLPTCCSISEFISTSTDKLPGKTTCRALQPSGGCAVTEFQPNLKINSFPLPFYLPQKLGYQLWGLALQVISTVITALLKKRSALASLLVTSGKPQRLGASGRLNWELLYYLKPS